METCATCKWWKLHKAYIPEGFCDRVNYLASKASASVLVSDNEYSAKLSTHGSFGCNQWEKQEE